jgi:hypothetical protein
MTGLNLSTGGEFSPFLKYNAKQGRWWVRGENATDVEVLNPRFAIDLENIRVGWVLFPQASPPLFVWDVQGVRGPKPAGDYKDGFKAFIMGTDPQPALANKPLGVREWSANAYAAKAGMMDLHRQYWEGKEQNPDKVPVCRCINVKVIKGEYGDSFEPVFIIETWVERSRLTQLTEAVMADMQAPGATPPSPQPAETAVMPLPEPATPANSGHTPTVTPPFQPPQEQTEKPFAEEVGDEVPF